MDSELLPLHPENGVVAGRLFKPHAGRLSRLLEISKTHLRVIRRTYDRGGIEERLRFFVLVVFCLTAEAEPSQDVVAAWRFNEGKGDVVTDSSGHGVFGRLQGRCDWAPGRIEKQGDTALHLDGKTGYAFFEWFCRDKPALELRSCTVAFWVKFDRLPEGEYFNVASSGTNLGAHLHGKSGQSSFSLFWKDPVTRDSYGLPAGDKHRNLKAGEWTHVAGVFDGAHVKLYINGEPDMYKSFYFTPKGTGAGEHKPFNLQEGVPYEGALQLDVFAIGVRLVPQEGAPYKCSWAPCAVDDLVIHAKALQPEMLGVRRSLDQLVGDKPTPLLTEDL